jgi:hypothetical protein
MNSIVLFPLTQLHMEVSASGAVNQLNNYSQLSVGPATIQKASFAAPVVSNLHKQFSNHYQNHYQ